MGQARQELNPQPAVLETAALPIELLAYNDVCSVLTKKNTLFGFAMQAVHTAASTVFVHFQAAGLVTPVLAGEIIAFLALGAGQSYKYAVAFLCHGLC